MSTWASLNSVSPTPHSEPPKPSAFDYLTKLIVPLAALILARYQRQTALIWALLAVAVVFLLAGFYPQFAGRARRLWRVWRDWRIARQAFPALRTFVERFGEFVSGQRNDTIHYIIQSDVCGNRSDIFSRFNLPNARIFQAFWSDLQMIAAEEKPTPANFKAAAAQLCTLVALYNNHCMDAVFRVPPQDFRSQLTDGSKSSLNESRERFNAFLEQYESFLSSLDRGFAERHVVGLRSFPRVKPL